MPPRGNGRPIEIGAPAPDFTLAMMDRGRPVSLADYRGKRALESAAHALMGPRRGD